MKTTINGVSRTIAVLIAVCVLSSATALYLMYRVEEESFELTLRRSASVHSDILTSLANSHCDPTSESNSVHSQHTCSAHVIDIIFSVYNRTHSDGYTGNIDLAWIEHDSITFALPQEGYLGPSKVALTSNLAEPMRRALGGQSGYMTATDIHGDQVLAAYQPIKPLGIGLVVSFPVGELRAPYFAAMGRVLLINVLLALVGSWLAHYFARPLIRHIEDKNSQLTIELTSRATIEAALHESREQYRHLLESLDDAIFSLDKRGLVTYFSPVILQITGFAPDELLGKHLTEFLSADDRHYLAELVAKRERQHVKSPEIKMVRKAGGVRTVIASIQYTASGPQGGAFHGILSDVTDRVHAEEQLRKTSTITHEITHSSRDGMIMVDGDARITFWNPAAEAIFGYSSKDALGQNMHHLVARNHPAQPIEAALSTFRSLGIGAAVGRTLQLDAIRKDGTIVRIELSLSSSRIDGKWCAIGVVRDITDRITTQERLSALETAVRNSGEVIFMSDCDGLFTYVNPAFTGLYGYEADEVVGVSTPRILKSGESSREAYHTFWSHLSDTGTYRGEFRNKTKEGKLVTVAACVNAIVDDRGNKKGYLAIQRDISQQKLDEQAIRESEARLKSVAEAMTEGLVVTASDHTILHVNSVLARMCGYQTTELIGKLESLFVPAKYHKLVDSQLMSRAHGISSSYEIELLRKDGSTFPVHVSAGPYIDTVNGTSGSVAVVSDISENKRVTDELRRLESQLRQAQKMEAIGTLAGGIAHDFNNILTPIMAYTDMVRITHKEDEELQNDLSKVLQAAERARGLVRQILTFSRQTECETLTIQPSHIVKEALKLLRAAIPANIDIQENICTNSEIQIDPTHIHQIIMNLCTNAFWAMRESGGQLGVSLADEVIQETYHGKSSDLAPGRYVKLVVQDSGTGMDEKTLSRIFDPFFTTKPVGEGTGLGLPVVHGIVKASGGSISIASQPGCGTQVEILFPIVAGNVVKPSIYDVRDIEGTERVLLIDDEPAIAEGLARSLSNHGYQVTTRTSSQDGLDAFTSLSDRIDIVVTDYAMPQMTGLQLAKLIRALKPDVQIIMMTGFSANVNESNISDYGVDRLIMKPVVGHDLAAAIRSLSKSDATAFGESV